MLFSSFFFYYFLFISSSFFLFKVTLTFNTLIRVKWSKVRTFSHSCNPPLLTHVPHRWKKVTSFSGHLCGYNAPSYSLQLRGWTLALQPQWCPKCRNPVWRSCLFKIKAWIRCLCPGAFLPLPLHLEHHRLRVLPLLVDVAYNFPPFSYQMGNGLSEARKSQQGLMESSCSCPTTTTTDL